MPQRGSLRGGTSLPMRWYILWSCNQKTSGSILKPLEEHLLYKLLDSPSKYTVADMNTFVYSYESILAALKEFQPNISESEWVIKRVIVRKIPKEVRNYPELKHTQKKIFWIEWNNWSSSRVDQETENQWRRWKPCFSISWRTETAVSNWQERKIDSKW